MADYYDVSEWTEMFWYQTGGTREKAIVQNPKTGEEYYFKTSLIKENKEYIHEFWSEIIASEIGRCLGFNVLRYDIAFNKDKIGCISKSMVTNGKNKLTEGINYLKGYDNDYNPESKESKVEYSFQRIKDTLEYFKIGDFIYDIIKIVIFDSIIGNSDRHQENWGIITDYDEVIDSIEKTHNPKEKLKLFMTKNKFLGVILKITLFLLKVKENKSELIDAFVNNLELFKHGKFSPIYDSGSCLGRELKDIKVLQMLKDDVQLEAYAFRGKSEIHWDKKKIRYSNLLLKIKEQYNDFIVDEITKISSNFKISEIRDIVENIDKNLPNDKKEHKLPKERKELIIKLITLRIEKLKEIIQ